MLSPEMFALKLSVLEKVLRPVIVYAAIVVMLRIFGKRELAQLNPFDLVVLLSISNTVQNAIIGDDNSVTGGLIGAFALFGINYLVVRLVFQHRRLDQVLEGKPTVLIDRGKVRPEGLARELLTESELAVVAHRQGIRSLDEIQRCVLEPGGVFLFDPKQPPKEQRRYEDVVARLDRLGRQLEEISRRLPAH